MNSASLEVVVACLGFPGIARKLWMQDRKIPSKISRPAVEGSRLIPFLPEVQTLSVHVDNPYYNIASLAKSRQGSKRKLECV